MGRKNKGTKSSILDSPCGEMSIHGEKLDNVRWEENSHLFVKGLEHTMNIPKEFKEGGLSYSGAQFFHKSLETSAPRPAGKDGRDLYRVIELQNDRVRVQEGTTTTDGVEDINIGGMEGTIIRNGFLNCAIVDLNGREFSIDFDNLDILGKPFDHIQAKPVFMNRGEVWEELTNLPDQEVAPSFMVTRNNDGGHLNV